MFLKRSQLHQHHLRPAANAVIVLQTHSSSSSSSSSRYLVLLLQLGDHDDDGGLLLPGHLPEVIHRVHHGTLRGDERLLVAEVTLRQEPITRQRQQPAGGSNSTAGTSSGGR